ncbi:TOTE conflict system archaeo-eukaryotic primase domain-containing protein [Cohnella soli]|uniref:TOTE conflict system primase domain-containing protein n=1 Tax=Cohnella soli TaxID=425005 RepID=A0ABW0HKL4_9BACL
MSKTKSTISKNAEQLKNNGEVKNKLHELYFIQRSHYLIQYKNYGYITYKQGKARRGEKVRGLQDYQMTCHLEGKYTVGTFSKYTTKFITFDVDFPSNKETAKWITYKVSHSLNSLGIEHHISFSGSKGWHIEVFFKDLIRIDHAKMFYNHILDVSEIRQYQDEGNKVEFRPTDKQGVKIPLGAHQDTGNYCGFCNVSDGLRVLGKDESEAYLLKINRIDSQRVLDIIGTEKDSIDKKALMQTEEAIGQYKPLPIYEQSEKYSIDYIKDAYINGLKVQGSRHSITFRICLYLKYHGLEADQSKAELYEWMEKQNPETYTTKLEDCFKDIDNIVRDVYEKDMGLAVSKRDLTVTYEEIKWIIDKCPEKNQKLIVYAMLIHSKRFATKIGVFYMKFKHIEEATGLDDNTVQRQVNKLISLGVIDAVERDRKQKGTYLRKPNKYRLNCFAESTNNEKSYKVDETQNDFTICLKYFFTEAQLKKLIPRRQFERLKVYT